MSEWIRVVDALPPSSMDGMPVIVTVVTSRGDIISEADAWHRYDKLPGGGKFDFWGEKVTHWMKAAGAAKMKNKLHRDLPWKPQCCLLGRRPERFQDMDDTPEKWAAISATAAILRAMRK